jgi:hypothetical protein
MLAQFVDRLRKKYPVTTRPDLVMRIRLIRDF